jgi:S1-C subfamily serine protease
MSETLDTYLQTCTVRLGNERGGGTGFFVAPGLVLTCAHVANDAKEGEFSLYWKGIVYPWSVFNSTASEWPDLALLSVKAPKNHPYVLLDAELQLWDDIYAYGYPGNTPHGDSILLQYEGHSTANAAQQRVSKLKGGQVEPGFSGSPILSKRTGAVCGILSTTRDRHNDLGGFATPTSVVFEEFPFLTSTQVNATWQTLQQTWRQTYSAPQERRNPPDVTIIIELSPWLLERMKKMLPAMLDDIAFQYGVPDEYIPGNATQADKARATLKFAIEKEGDNLPKLRKLVEKATGRTFPN